MAQLICGHRAETIQMRRDGIIYHVRDPLVKSQLRKIPPSNKHVFNAESLTIALEKIGGVKKAFLPPKQTGGHKSASQASKNATSRFPSQGQVNPIVPTQGTQHSCCFMPYPPQPSQGCGHKGMGQNRPSQGFGNNYTSARGSSVNSRGSFRPRGGNQQRGSRQEARNNRKRPAVQDYHASGKRGRY